MLRRHFLAGLPALALTGCQRLDWQRAHIQVSRPGRDVGHALRDGRPWPKPSEEQRIGVLVVGSGVAGLTAAWTLARAGHHDVALVTGPEPLGNAAGGQFATNLGTTPFPTGAHYLPLPSLESRHIREMLAACGVLESGIDATHPRYDERVLVHAPESRLHDRDGWQPGLVPEDDPADARQQARFFEAMTRWTGTSGRDDRRAFCVPTALSSQDPAFEELDRITFGAWLDRQGYDAPGLRWYLDYCCRDDYGAPASRVSAWAGLHYFASRSGHAENAEDGAVLTWPDGLAPLAAYLRKDAARLGVREIDGFAVSISPRDDGAEVILADRTGARTLRVRAPHVICAMPLHVALRVVDDLPGYAGVEVTPPVCAPWLVATHLLEGFPREKDNAPLAWDNVVRDSPHLGYVHAGHQRIGLARPREAVFTTFHALADRTPDAARAWLARVSDDELADFVSADLEAVYGRQYRRRLRRLDITVRGHAMATPTPGFRTRPDLRVLREVSGPVLFAHADLSGLSVFEEAAWWGRVAARKVIGLPPEDVRAGDTIKESRLPAVAQSAQTAASAPAP